MSFFALMAFGSAFGQDRFEIDLKIHPVKLTFKANKKNYYKIFGEDGVMYITSEKKIYTDIAGHLPTKAIVGRSVTIVGASLPLSGILTAKQIRKIYRQKGIDLNQVTVYEVTNYQLNDLEKTGKKLTTYGSSGKPESFDKNGQPVREN